MVELLLGLVDLTVHWRGKGSLSSSSSAASLLCCSSLLSPLLAALGSVLGVVAESGFVIGRMKMLDI